MGKYLILGGSSGIGKSIAKICLQNSKEVIITGRNEEKLLNANRELCKIGKSSSLKIDLGDLKNVDLQIDQFIQIHKSIDGLVINGPLPPLKSFESSSMEDWLYSTNSTILSSVLIIKKLLSCFNKESSIVFILSDTCRSAGVAKSISTSLRLALSGLMKSLAIEYASDKIRFNAISPGPTLTDRAKSLFENGAKKQNISYEEFKDNFTKTLPSKRLIDPSEIADLVYYLLSKNSSSLTGVNIPFDGALTQIPL